MSNYEYELFDGEYFHTLNLVKVTQDKTVATVAITCAGKISVQEFDLQENENGLNKAIKQYLKNYKDY